MAGYFDFFRKIKTADLPCNRGVECPYEYDKNSERDIEGMPFLEGDSRSCPKYGHICPEYMKYLGLTVEDLKTRAVVHCAEILENPEFQNQTDPDSPQFKALSNTLIEIRKKFPFDKYPQFYD